MVFGEYLQGYLPQLFIACVVVVPGRKLGDIGEMEQRFDDNGKREDVPIYPMKALREAIAYKLCLWILIPINSNFAENEILHKYYENIPLHIIKSML